MDTWFLSINGIGEWENKVEKKNYICWMILALGEISFLFSLQHSHALWG